MSKVDKESINRVSAMFLNGIGEYEVPGTTLEEKGQPGMHFYSDIIVEDGSRRIRIYVPTSVYDKQVAQILAYETTRGLGILAYENGIGLPEEAEKLVVIEKVTLRSMPRWEMEKLVLSRKDHRNVVEAAKDLEAKLSKE